VLALIILTIEHRRYDVLYCLLFEAADVSSTSQSSSTSLPTVGCFGDPAHSSEQSQSTHQKHFASRPLIDAEGAMTFITTRLLSKIATVATVCILERIPFAQS